MDKMKMESPNLTAANIEKIAALFPNCITETVDETGKLKKAINFDMLRAMLSEDIASEDEAYEFTWVGKKASIAEAHHPIRKTLRPVINDETTPTGKDSDGNPYYSSGSVNWDTTENLYIEGDNLDVLKLLQQSYLGKIKIIYIDPPYNTGNDFMYHDDFAMSSTDYAEESGQIDEDGNRLFQNTNTNGRFHSEWCGMIYSRLLLARKLLTDDGVIFISIDDNELENLKKICDEVFGAQNYINTIAVNMNSLSGVKMTHVISGKRFPAQKEYLLLYKKGIQPVSLYIEKTHKTEWDPEYNLIIPEMQLGQFDAFAQMSEEEVNSILSKMHLVSLVEFARSSGIELTDEWKWENAFRIFGSKSNRPLAKKVRDRVFQQQIVGYRNSDGNMRFFRSDFNRETRDPRIELVQAESNSSVFISDNWIDISNDGGVAQEGGVVFPNGKKPLKLIKRILKAGNSNDCIVLDFFSGSATTAHAVMQLNAEDGGHRKYIMVQLPETTWEMDTNGNRVPKKQNPEAYKAGLSTICEIGKARIRYSAEKIKQETGAEIDYGFRVLKLDETNMQDVYYTPAETTQTMLAGFESNIKEDRTDLDLLFGCLLDWGLPLSMPYESEQIEGVTVHNYNNGDLIACFETEISERAIKAIAKRCQEYHQKFDGIHTRVVFRDSSFADSASKINANEIFNMISPATKIKVI